MSNPSHFPLQLYCKQLTDLFQQAISQPDPGLWLYQKEARSTLFMAESLARVLASATQDKRAVAAYSLFKKLEDLLGEIDDYDHLAKYYAKYESVKQEEINYFTTKYEKRLEKLNKKLIKNEFYQFDFNEVAKHLVVNFNDGKLVEKLKAQIQLEINKCWRFYSIFSNGFTDMEGQVHEIRRKLRWISIYGQSFNGLIVLEQKKGNYNWEKKYLTKKDSENPFNSLIFNKDFKKHIVFDQKVFYAFNKVIADLGDIKNKGLQIEYLAKSIHKTHGVNTKDAEGIALQQLKVKHTVEDLLNDAHLLLKDFFETNAIHEALI